jgi:hypothetical protein
MTVKAAISENVFGEDMTRFADLLPEPTRGFYLAPRGEHYKLLKNLGRQFPGPKLDIGTATGASALALYDGSPSVISYDTAITPRPMEDITWRTGDGIAAIPGHLGCSLILLDVDPHDGWNERACVSILRGAWTGLLVCDDIHLNTAMHEWWEQLPEPKWDVTAFGHHTGTGIIGFGGAEVLLG